MNIAQRRAFRDDYQATNKCQLTQKWIPEVKQMEKRKFRKIQGQQE
jgi:hypothetical protein